MAVLLIFALDVPAVSSLYKVSINETRLRFNHKAMSVESINHKLTLHIWIMSLRSAVREPSPLYPDTWPLCMNLENKQVFIIFIIIAICLQFQTLFFSFLWELSGNTTWFSPEILPSPVFNFFSHFRRKLLFSWGNLIHWNLWRRAYNNSPKFHRYRIYIEYLFERTYKLYVMVAHNHIKITTFNFSRIFQFLQLSN